MTAEVKPINAGTLDKLIQFALESAHRPQPTLALSAALTTISLLCRNRYEITEYRTRPNIYTLNVCPTGGGKESIARTVKAIAADLGLMDLIAEGVASGPALLRALSTTGTLLFWKDEIWQMLESINSDRGSTHDKSLGAECMALFGAATNVYSGKRYADEKNNVPPIEHPYLVFCGATTPGRLMDCISTKQVGDGFLNRLIVFRTDEVPPIQRPQQTQPGTLSRSLRAIGAAGTPDRPVAVPIADDAQGFLKDVSVAADHHMREPERGALYSRVFENTLRVAMLIAISDAPSRPVISLAAAERAARIVLGSAKGITDAMKAEHADNPHDRLCKRVLAMIANGKRYESCTRWGPYCMDGMMPKGKLLTLTGVKSPELQDAINTLMGRGDIFRHTLTGRGGRAIEAFAVNESLP